jgi:hypothetical protein
MSRVLMPSRVVKQCGARLRAFGAVRASAASPAPPAPPKKCWLLLYSYVPDILERRGPFRDAHLAGAQRQVQAGNMLVAGAYTDPTDGAAFMWTPKATRAGIEAFVAADPYVTAGLVTSHSVREWAVPVLHPTVDAML